MRNVKDRSETLLSVLSVIDKHGGGGGVQGILGLIFTNIFKNKLLWSVTSTLMGFTIAGKGFTLQNTTT